MATAEVLEPVEAPEGDRLRTIAKKIYQKHGTGDKAKKALSDAIARDFAQFAYDFTAHELLLGMQRYDRADVKTGGRGTFVRRYSVELQQTVGARAARWLDWPLMDNLRLKDATRIDIDANIKKHWDNGAGNMKDALFLEAVRNKLKDDKQRVGKVFKEPQLDELWNAAVAKVEEIRPSILPPPEVPAMANGK